MPVVWAALLLVFGAANPRHKGGVNASRACSNHADCPTGDYCDNTPVCYECDYITPGICDSFDGDCCTPAFLANCPGNPHGCNSPGICEMEPYGTCDAIPMGSAVLAADLDAGSNCYDSSTVTAVAANGTLGVTRTSDSKWLGWRAPGYGGSDSADVLAHSGAVPTRAVDDARVGLGVLAPNPDSGCLEHGLIEGASAGGTWAVQFSGGATHANIPSSAMNALCFPGSGAAAARCAGAGSGTCAGLEVGGNSRVVAQLKRPSASYIGCFVDNDPTSDLPQHFCANGNGPREPNDRDCPNNGNWQENMAGSGSMTPELCAKNCNFDDGSGSPQRYFGVQCGSQCFCGKSYGSQGRAPESGCSVPCAGDASQVCGGCADEGNHNSIYSLPYLPPTDHYYSGTVAALRDDGMYLIELTDGNTTWASLGRGGAIPDLVRRTVAALNRQKRPAQPPPRRSTDKTRPFFLRRRTPPLSPGSSFSSRAPRRR
jgi:hypothetical protein